MAENSIAADKLCALTGLTDRRHRQLAKAGYFPPPVKSEYQLSATIKGLFKYYREGNQNSNESLLGEKLRETRHRANLLEMEEKEKLRQLLPAADVERVWGGIMVAIRQSIWNCDAPEIDRRRWLDELKALKIEDYLTKDTHEEADEQA